MSKANVCINERITAYKARLDEIIERLEENNIHENYFGEDVPISYYDDYCDLPNLTVPLERVENDLKEAKRIVKEYYSQCREDGCYDDFVTGFAMYCNFYISRGFICRREDSEGEMFGLRRSDFKDIDDNLWAYMEKIYKGIKTQDYTHFAKATEINDGFSVAHLYLFIFFAFLTYSEEFESEAEHYREIMLQEFSLLSYEYREYAVTYGDSHKDENLNNLKQLLPYITTKTFRETYLDNLETHVRELFNVVKKDEPYNKQVMYFSFIRDTLKALDNAESQLEPIEPIEPIEEDWATLPPLYRDHYLHIYNQVPIGNLRMLMQTLEDERNAVNALNAELQNSLVIKEGLVKELNASEAAKKEMISDFSHTFKNMRTTSLHDVAEALLKMDDKALKMHGRTVLLEYGVKKDMIREVEMLRLRFEDKNEELRERMLTSTKCEYSDGHTIRNAIRNAINRCVITLVHDSDDEASAIRKSCFKGKDLISLRNSFETQVLFNDNVDIIEWLGDNIIDITLTISDSWDKLRFKEGSHAEIVFTDLFTDLFMNIFKYADKTQPASLVLGEIDTELTIKAENTAVKDKTGIPGTGRGLFLQNNMWKKLNQSVGINCEAVLSESNEDKFSAYVRIGKKLFWE